MNEEKRLQRRQRLMDNKAYQTMEGLTRYMDRYYLDALIGVIPGWGDAIALICVVPFVYFSSRVIKSVPLTLAVLNNALRDVLLGMIPFFVGDIIDIFHRANTQNMQMIQGFVDGDETVIKQVNQRVEICHCPFHSSPAHCPYDLAAHIFWQLPVLSTDIHCLNEFKNWQHCLIEFKFRAILTFSECHFDNRHESCTMSGES